MAVYTHCHIVQILDVACQCWPVPALAKVKMWEVFPEAEDGSLVWCDEFDYTGQLHVLD